MIMTKEHKEVREWEYIRGRKEAISEFKEKLKEEMCIYRFTGAKKYCNDCKNCNQIDKTAQEITG